ncbi:MAG: DUF4876 domain-containing protein [Bacteroidales bacterium]|nr:DUF4876 domain-containing protein [Bacteroidales bacterium]
MKKVLSLLVMVAALAVAYSCEPKEEPQDVTIQLTQNDVNYAKEGITVTVSGPATFEATTNAQGVATFSLPVGIYDASVAFRGIDANGVVTNCNGKTAITVVDKKADPNAVNDFKLPVIASQGSQLIIKEVYAGGCQKNDNSGTYANDKYIILYNNAGTEVDASKICIGHINPPNAHASNKYYDKDGKLTYTDWLPAGYGYWYFTTTVKIPAYSQIVISIMGAVNHTETYTNSVDLSNADYVMYDKESGFNMASYYPAPAFTDASRYMKAVKYGLGTGWVTSNFSPGFFLFRLDNPATYADDKANLDETMGATMPNAIIREAAIVDGAEIFNIPKLADSKTRFIPSVDAGYAKFTNGQGYSIYRNVDKEATEALAENAGKLVYNYAGGTVAVDAENGTTDPSGIDAEASIANGAHIIYLDTNNSSNDFHQRKVASIKK